MALVHFSLDDLTVEAPDGTALVAIAEAAGADITFGCKGGACGTCRVRIAEGLERCSPPSREERDFLWSVDAAPDHRLACQTCVSGAVTVDYVGL